MSEANELTDEENRAIRLLWDKGGASADELALALAEPAAADHAATVHLLRGLDRKGAVARHRTGRDVIYRPVLNKQTAETHVLGRALSNDGPEKETGGLNVIVLRQSDVDPQDWADLQAEIAARRKRDA